MFFLEDHKMLIRQSAKIALTALLTLSSLQAISATTYRVKAGDTLDSISKQYDVSTKTLMEINNIKSANTIKIGDLLIINDSVAVSYAGKTTVYTVQAGDTIGQIAKKFDTTTPILAELNPSLQNDFNQIYIDQKLVVPQKGSIPVITSTSSTNTNQATATAITSQPEIVKKFTGKNKMYTVKSGDTLVKIANRFNLKVQDIARVNGFSGTYHVKLGETLYIPEFIEDTRNTTPEQGPAGNKAIKVNPTNQSKVKSNTPLKVDSFQYTVKQGETLLGLARKHKVSLSTLANLNGLKTNSQLKIGQKLIIPTVK